MKYNLEQKRNNGGMQRGESSGNNKEGKEGNLKKTCTCKNCGKNYSGMCLKGRNVCFKCGQERHIALNCTNPRNDACFVCGALDHQTLNCPN